jgi:hypothetical protein
MRLLGVFLATWLVAGCGGDAFSGGNTGAFAGGGGAPGTGGASGSSGTATGGASAAAGASGTGGASAGAAGVGTGGTTGGSGGSAGSGGVSGMGGATVGTGGSTTGGAAGTGGVVQIDAGPAGGSGGGSTGYAECKTAADCDLFTDCCTCQAVPKGTTLPSCKEMCLQSDCAARTITSADLTCNAGRCVLARSCNEKTVACDMVTPACASEQGMAPIVTTSCYQGSCLPVAECSDVTSCDVCTKAGLACATTVLRTGSTYHCVTIPEKCGQAPTCACMGVCTGMYQCSQPGGKDLVCSCPTC